MVQKMMGMKIISGCLDGQFADIPYMQKLIFMILIFRKSFILLRKKLFQNSFTHKLNDIAEIIQNYNITNQIHFIFDC